MLRHFASAIGRNVTPRPAPCRFAICRAQPHLLSKQLHHPDWTAAAAVVAGSAAALALATGGPAWAQERGVRCEAASEQGRFAGAVIVITGAGGDFGRAGAQFFKREGAHVVLLDAAAEGLGRTEAALACMPGPPCLSVMCDITSDSSVDAAVAAAERKFGKITHLWNNAGYQGVFKPSVEYPVSDFQRVQDINVVGSFRVMQAVGASMKKTGGGVIVNTASVAALRGTPAMPAYVASKAALIGLTMSVAKDFAPYNIRVNAISPALIGPGFMWDRQNELHAACGSPYFARDAETVAKNKIAGVPMKRLGSIDEVVKSVAFLLSDESSYCNGFNLIVDGGLQMR
eukprot:gnl/TRDRNA2_/TRDRNA2_89558_c0_seq2.p1 gnl/TRDRNA2_/TRDRNA2_89558_c0~~gnl/TRDRNA2_/TRDRNA2_89558_c0_seq2.p1  ORF type:complete len:344 (+),score=56.64 gnl/TRDRNA2_/TRDRNA2_89558_c0_seq2:38-1069(+)